LTGVSDTLIANLYGGIAVGAAQGILAGVFFLFLGLSAPILWALVTALASLVPIFGSALVWGPASILLLLSGHWAPYISNSGSFIGSDNPVSLDNYGDKRRAGFKTADLVFFPVSRHVVLVGTKLPKESGDVTRKWIARHNTFTC
jgi:hypothetical protein